MNSYNPTDRDDTHDQHAEAAEVFGQESDPLAKYSDGFYELSYDPFELYVSESVAPEKAEATINNYQTTYRQWKRWMEQYDRHPACPNQHQIKQWAWWLIEDKGVQRSTVRSKLTHLIKFHSYLQDEQGFPMTADYNPYASARHKLDLTKEPPKEVQNLSLETIRDEFESIKHVRDRAVIAAGFKLGLRASEVSNIKIEDVHIDNGELLDHYEDMGTAPGLEGRTNAIYIPHDRKRNKSQRPRTIPLDEEMRLLLLDWLLIRPDVDEPWLFLSQKQKGKIHRDNVNQNIWQKHFEEYEGDERRRPVSSHYGRHYLTTYLHERTSLTRAEVKYLRGDLQSSGDIESTREAIDSYIHVYYDDIADKFRDEVYRLRV